MSDSVQFGCMRCKKTKRSKRAVEAAQKTMEDIFEAAFTMLREEAHDLDVEIPIEFKGKMLKWGAKYHVFAPEPDPEAPAAAAPAVQAAIVSDRNKLD